MTRMMTTYSCSQSNITWKPTWGRGDWRNGRGNRRGDRRSDDATGIEGRQLLHLHGGNCCYGRQVRRLGDQCLLLDQLRWWETEGRSVHETYTTVYYSLLHPGVKNNIFKGGHLLATDRLTKFTSHQPRSTFNIYQHLAGGCWLHLIKVG